MAEGKGIKKKTQWFTIVNQRTANTMAKEKV